MNNEYFEFFCPVKIIAGNKALEHLPFELVTLGASRPLIITDKGVHENGLIDHVLGVFEESFVSVVDIYDDVPADSSAEVVRKVADFYLDKKCDSIIAVGGGSVIDTSKGVNVLVSENAADLRQFMGANSIKKPLKPFFVLPTTAGTGSEASIAAMFMDNERDIKIGLTSQFLLPNAAILDPRMTLTLPPQITAATAMDALTHAMESYICMAKNPLSDAYAIAAIRKISENLINVLKKPDNPDGRLKLAQAATMAGIAFSNSMVGLVHALGHSLGALCHLPHGLCMNIFLPHALEFNICAREKEIGELLWPLAGIDVYAATPESERAAKTIECIHNLRQQIHAACRLPLSLSETGKVEREQVSQVAEMSLMDGLMIMNPIDVSYEDSLKIVEKAW